MSGRLSKICDWEHLARESDFDPAKMASLCLISQRQLQRFFKKSFQMNPRDWLRILRCSAARKLIAQGYSTKAAAAEMKFATEAHFCREFRKVFGVSPQTFAPRFVGRPKMSLSDNNVAIG